MVVRLNRRRFLRGLGGAAVAVPFLSSVEERAAKAQGEVPPAAPRRLIVMFTHYGCLTDRWFPQKAHGPLNGDDFTGTSLEVLAPHAGKLLLPRGIRAMNEWTATMARGQGNDQHTQVCGSYFTCAPVSPHSDEPFSFEAATKFEAMPTAASLDHVCAKQLNGSGLPLVLRVGNRNDSPQSGISYSAPLTPFPGVGTPAEALANLTGLFVDGAPMSPDSYQTVRGRSIIDLVRDDLEALERVDMSMSDKHKLAAWKELLHETVDTVVSRYCKSDTASELGLTGATLQAFEQTLSEGGITAEVGAGRDVADLYSNVAVLAALCDQTRVTVLKYPALYVFGGLGLAEDAHLLSHRAPTNIGACGSGVNAAIQSIDRYYAQKFAHLIGELDRFDEGTGTLLDHTAAVWFQELSDGNAHNLNNMPILQAGGCGGYFKTGQAVNLHDGAAELHRGRSSVVCDDPTTQDRSTGTPPEIGNAPINKYYCNLMNALGVKAGIDGFPQPEGTEEVIRYGTYDDTADFASGGSNPAEINDPGGFDALRAGS